MVFVISFAMFLFAFAAMGVGVLFARPAIRGTCGGDEVEHDGESLSCGACPRKQSDICPSDDELVRLATISHPNPQVHH